MDGCAVWRLMCIACAERRRPSFAGREQSVFKRPWGFTVAGRLVDERGSETFVFYPFVAVERAVRSDLDQQEQAWQEKRLLPPVIVPPPEQGPFQARERIFTNIQTTGRGPSGLPWSVWGPAERMARERKDATAVLRGGVANLFQAICPNTPTHPV